MFFPKAGEGKPATGPGTWRAAAFSRAAALGPGLEGAGCGGKGATGDSEVSLLLRLAGCAGWGGGGPRRTRLASLGRGEGATDNSGGRVNFLRLELPPGVPMRAPAWPGEVATCGLWEFSVPPCVCKILGLNYSF